MVTNKTKQLSKSLTGMLGSEVSAIYGALQYGGGHHVTAAISGIVSIGAALLHVHGINGISVNTVKTLANDVVSAGSNQMTSHQSVNDKRGVETLDGIGSKKGSVLKAGGFSTIGDVLSAPADYIFHECNEKLTVDEIRNIQSTAQEAVANK